MTSSTNQTDKTIAFSNHECTNECIFSALSRDAGMVAGKMTHGQVAEVLTTSFDRQNESWPNSSLSLVTLSGREDDGVEQRCQFFQTDWGCPTYNGRSNKYRGDWGW